MSHCPMGGGLRAVTAAVPLSGVSESVCDGGRERVRVKESELE
jgi:hypothetical protein